MEKQLSPLELMDKFMNSDPAYIKSMLEEFENLDGEGPSVSEYFKSFDTQFIFENNSSVIIDKYDRVEELNLDLRKFKNTKTKNWIKVRGTQPDSLYETITEKPNSYSVAA